MSSKRSKKTLDYYMFPAAPYCPSMTDFKAASSTKNITKKEFKLGAEDGLRGIVYIDDLLDKIANRAAGQAKKCAVNPDTDREWLAFVNPEHTHFSQPMIAKSEQDIREWFGAVIARPALHIVRIILAGLDFKDANRTKTIAIEPRATHPHTATICITSMTGGKSKTIPDAGLYHMAGGKVPEDLKLTFEYKTPNALKDTDFSKVLVGLTTARKPVVVPFKMPKRTSEGISKETTILIQVYSQMKKRVRHAILSSYQKTLFIYLGKNNVLYISKPFGLEVRLLDYVVAWMLQSFGELQDEFDESLQTVDETLINKPDPDPRVDHGLCTRAAKEYATRTL